MPAVALFRFLKIPPLPGSSSKELPTKRHIGCQRNPEPDQFGIPVFLYKFGFLLGILASLLILALSKGSQFLLSRLADSLLLEL